MLLEFTQDNFKIVRVYFNDVIGERKAKMLVMKKRRKMAAPNVNVRKMMFLKKDEEAYFMDDAVIATLPTHLKEDIITRKLRVAQRVEAATHVKEAYDLRDKLLTLPIDEAITFTTEINGEMVNVVDYIIPILQKDFEYRTNDGYRNREYMEISETIDF